MTVIVYRSGIMAADTAVWDNDGHIVGRANKIHRLRDGGLVTGSGWAGSIMSVRNWIESGAPADAKPSLRADSYTGMWVKPDGSVVRFAEELVDQETIADFYVLSCKMGFTLGCLYAGAGAYDAVLLTLMHTDAGFGAGYGGIDVQAIDMSPKGPPE